MMYRYLVFVVLITLPLGLVTACVGDGTGTPTRDKVRPEPPAEYSTLRNPLDGNSEAASDGRDIYRIHCAMCHGEKGEGNGPASNSLNPKPESFSINQDKLTDTYLYWRISEGGLKKPFSSAMPSWESILSEEEIWKIITYLRTLKPENTSL